MSVENSEEGVAVDEEIQRILDENEAGVRDVLEIYERAEARYTQAAPAVWSQTTYGTSTG